MGWTPIIILTGRLSGPWWTKFCICLLWDCSIHLGISAYLHCHLIVPCSATSKHGEFLLDLAFLPHTVLYWSHPECDCFYFFIYFSLLYLPLQSQVLDHSVTDLMSLITLGDMIAMMILPGVGQSDMLRICRFTIERPCSCAYLIQLISSPVWAMVWVHPASMDLLPPVAFLLGLTASVLRCMTLLFPFCMTLWCDLCLLRTQMQMNHSSMMAPDLPLCCAGINLTVMSQPSCAGFSVSVKW